MEKVGEDNIVQVIIDNALNYVMVAIYNLISNFQLFMYVCREVVGIENATFVLDTMCCTLS